MADIDILNIQPNKVSKDLKGKYILIYGAPKIGKTTFCATQLPNVLLLAGEVGYHAIPGVRAVDITKWNDVKKIVKQLDSPQAKEMYSTIVFDTIDIFAQLCEEYVCQQNGVADISEVPFGKLYKVYTKEFSSLLRKITMLGYGIVFVGHQEIKLVKNDKGEEYETLQPVLDKRALKVVNALVDFVLYVGQEWDENGNNNRFFYTRNTPFIMAGSRFGEMAPKIPFSYEALISEITKAMESSVKGDLTMISDKDERIIQENKRPFRETMQEAGEIWMKFPKTPDWNEKKMKIVEEYFGQPIKLSTATESQQDLVESVIEDLKNLLSTVK